MTSFMKKSIFFIMLGGIGVTPLAHGWSFFSSKTDDKKLEDSPQDTVSPKKIDKERRARSEERSEKFQKDFWGIGEDRLFGNLLNKVDSFFEDVMEARPWKQSVWSYSAKDFIGGTDIPKNFKRCSEGSFEISGINALDINGEGEIGVQLIGTKNSGIKVEVYGENTKASAPNITQNKGKALVNIPASSKKIIYRFFLPEDIDVSLAGKKVSIATENMSEKSFISVTTKNGYSVSICQEKHNEEQNGSFSNSFSSHLSNNNGPATFSFFGSGETEKSYTTDTFSDKLFSYEQVIEHNYDVLSRRYRFSQCSVMQELENIENNLRDDLKRISTDYVQKVSAAFPSIKNNKVAKRYRDMPFFMDFLNTLAQVDFLSFSSRDGNARKIKDDIMNNKEKRSKFFQIRDNMEKDFEKAFRNYEDKFYRLVSQDEGNEDEEEDYSRAGRRLERKGSKKSIKERHPNSVHRRRPLPAQ